MFCIPLLGLAMPKYYDVQGGQSMCTTQVLYHSQINVCLIISRPSKTFPLKVRLGGFPLRIAITTHSYVVVGGGYTHTHTRCLLYRPPSLHLTPPFTHPLFVWLAACLCIQSERRARRLAHRVWMHRPRGGGGEARKRPAIQTRTARPRLTHLHGYVHFVGGGGPRRAANS